MAHFHYLSEAELLAQNGINIPLGLMNRQELFDFLVDALELPDYFNDNWDSLEECVRDLSWIQEEAVVLIHHDLPMIGDVASLKIYLAIIHSALDRNLSRTKPQLRIVFPLSLKINVEALMQ